MRVAHMVTRNEADRYLAVVLEQLKRFGFDAITVFDDQSTDDTRQIAFEAGAHVRERMSDEPSFLDDEAAFRRLGWDWSSRLTGADVVVSIDADEMLVAGPGYQTAIDALDDAERMLASAVFPTKAMRLNIHEVWAIDDGVPQFRTDGLWAGINGVRLTGGATGPFRPGLGCGSVPMRYFADDCPRTCTALAIAHLGYLDPADRRAKQARYEGKRGHNPVHVRSITDPFPTLTPAPALTPWPAL